MREGSRAATRNLEARSPTLPPPMLGPAISKRRGRQPPNCRRSTPGFTVQKSAGSHWSDDPTFNGQQQHITEGLRKAGLPEGEKKTD